MQYIVKSNKKNYSIANNIKNKGNVSRITPREVRSLEKIIKKIGRNTVRTLTTMWSSSIGRPIGRENTRNQLKKLNYGLYKVSSKCIYKFVFITASVSTFRQKENLFKPRSREKKDYCGLRNDNLGPKDNG